MYDKIQIKGTIEIKTGLHIGGSTAFSAIGAVDSPVIKDARNNLPMIPGSSLKGKLRTLLAKEYNEKPGDPDNDADRIVRLFGCAKSKESEQPVRSRILISDMFLSNAEELRGRGLQSLTEVKFENTINRLTAVANPRQIERVVRGSKFELDIIYEVDQEDQKGQEDQEKKILEDMETLAMGFRLLEYDYLGGNGSRGYGKVIFTDLNAKSVLRRVPSEIIDQCNKKLEKENER